MKLTYNNSSNNNNSNSYYYSSSSNNSNNSYSYNNKMKRNTCMGISVNSCLQTSTTLSDISIR